MADQTRAVLWRLDLRAGARCLDVGCGAGDVLPLLAELAGRDGSVTGIDRNDTLGASGLAALRAAWPGQLDFIQDDVLTTTALEPGAFDLTFARLVLLHMPDPKALLARMWAWTRPGGCLLMLDYDFITQGAAPPLAAMDEYNRLIFDLFTKIGRDPRIGHKLPAYLADVCGGGPVQTSATPSCCPLRRWPACWRRATRVCCRRRWSTASPRRAAPSSFWPIYRRRRFRRHTFYRRCW
jgi:ubiquinone/menaquinone biosynthesis C-methylase UbiE